jgi:hypothetical protein
LDAGAASKDAAFLFVAHENAGRRHRHIWALVVNEQPVRPLPTILAAGPLATRLQASGGGVKAFKGNG